MTALFKGDRLRAEREHKGVSQAALADQTGSTIRYIRALETGEKSNPSAELLCKAAMVLDVSMETFMEIRPDEDDELYRK